MTDPGISFTRRPGGGANTARHQFWSRRLGDPKNNAAKFAAISPLRHADKVSIPVFVAHGVADRTVPIEHAKRFVGALESAGVAHVARFEKDQDHLTAGFKDRLALCTAIEAFLQQHLGAAK